LLLLVPEVRVSTPEAFGWLDEDRDAPPPHPAAALPPAADLSRWDVLLSLRGNDFEAPVFARIPELAWWKEELLGEGAEAALLCGSGSTLCGVFGDERRRDAAADRLRESGELRVVRTRGPV
jgi:4-diphosphocytidyl-2-C-methyl-D-erythritol kinase